MKVTSTRQGFTIIELLVVIVVIAILATLAISNFGNIPAQGRDSDRKSDMRQLEQQLALYAQDNGYYPAPITPTTADDTSGWEAIFDDSVSANLSPEVVLDPDETVLNHADSDYSYTAVESDGTTACTAAAVENCTGGYTLTSTLETEEDDFEVTGNSIGQ